MKLKNIDVLLEIKKVEEHLASNPALSNETRALIQMLITIINLMVGFFGSTSKNSSKPPSQDPHRQKKKRAPSDKKSGGQKGHEGTTLERSLKPDEIVELKIPRDTLPADRTFQVQESISRQVYDVVITSRVTEYQAEVLIDDQGNKYIASFPKGVDAPVQYGPSVRGLAVYLSSYQMLPFERAQNLFQTQMGLPISAGTLSNINAQASQLLEEFESSAKKSFLQAPLIHSDETSVNIAGKTHWLHSLSNEAWTLFFVHSKRGQKAMDDMGVLPVFQGVVMHDNWASYFAYEFQHALCNAHHIRELTRAFEDDGQKWAEKMIQLLLSIKKEVESTPLNKLSPERLAKRNLEYDTLIAEAQMECPAPPSETLEGKKKRGRQKKSKSRNLLERLTERKKSVLLFMEEGFVPFTNNLAERDLRMTKVQQKISGCFRSEKTANDFCRVRSFISTCIKQNVDVASALTNLFKGQLPSFCSK